MRMKDDLEDGLPYNTSRPTVRRGRGAAAYQALGLNQRQGRKKREPVQQLFNWTIGLLLLLVIFLLLRKTLSRSNVGSTEPTTVKNLRPFADMRNLVMVACHAVYTGSDYSKPLDFGSWFLLDYQKVPGQTESFMQHIQLGVRAAAADPEALLMFSGGQTRVAAGARSEAASYWGVANAAGWFGKPEVAARSVNEEHARDSFENLLFSLCRFHALTGHYPERLLLVSYEFKHERFAGLHAKALRWPTTRLDFLGTPALTPGALEGEARTVAAFRHDPYGCRGELREKRTMRDPFAQGPYSAEHCPSMAPLMSSCSTVVYSGKLLLPWEHA